jgi:hypothetical protein
MAVRHAPQRFNARGLVLGLCLMAVILLAGAAGYGVRALTEAAASGAARAAVTAAPASVSAGDRWYLDTTATAVGGGDRWYEDAAPPSAR